MVGVLDEKWGEVVIVVVVLCFNVVCDEFVIEVMIVEI